MARDDMFDGLERSIDSCAKRTSGPLHQQQQLQDGADPAAQTSIACCETSGSPLLSVGLQPPGSVRRPALPRWRRGFHRLTRGEQQGKPGLHCDDVAPSLQKTKRILEATDASGRPLAVVQLFDNLQQPSTWEVSPRTKHEVERLLRSDVSSRLVHPALQRPVAAAVTQAEAVREAVRPASPTVAVSKQSRRNCVTQERRRMKTALRQLRTRPAATAKSQARELPLHDPVAVVPKQSLKPVFTRTTSSVAKSEQMADADAREKHEVRRTVQFEIGDDEAFEKFCETTFNDLQQLAMKTILKAWIKELEPKKQKRYPYCRTYKTGHPEWWPAPEVPHKEPDHLSKSERSILAMRIIWYIMQPKFNGQGVNRLEDSTRSCKLEYESDKHWMPARRQNDLKQLYAVARKRYMFENDEMDGNDLVSVSCLYKEPGRKRGRHRSITKANVNPSPPQTESSSQDHRHDDDIVMSEDSSPPNLRLRHVPASIADTDSIPPNEEPLIRQPISQAYVPGMASASHLFEQNSFRPQQRDGFPPGAVLIPQHHFMHQIPGTQAYQYFEPPPMQWQPTAVASGLSPITPQDPVNSSFDSSFDVVDIPWPSSAPLLLSSLQPNSAAAHGLPIAASAHAPASLSPTAAAELFALERPTNGMDVNVTNSIHPMVEPYNGSTRDNMSVNKYESHSLENSAESMTRVDHNSDDLFHRAQDTQPWIPTHTTPRVYWATAVPCYPEPTNTDQ